MKRFKTNHVLLISILIIAVFFRFYAFKEFQYFSGDEELMTATIRHIIRDRSPSLIVQSAALGFGLGPFYHYFLTPFFYFSRFDLVRLQAIASSFGILTTILVYLGGKELGGKKLGLTASLLYASSFFISLFDRRLVHLTLDPVMASLTFFVLAKVIKKNYRYIPLLALPIGFSFHVDASLMVLVISIILAFIVFRIPIRTKYGLVTVVILIIFAAPLLLAEIRYHGAVSQPILKSLTRPLRSGALPTKHLPFYPPWKILDVLSRVIFIGPSSFIEQHFCYCEAPPALFSPFTQLFVLLVFLIGGVLLFKAIRFRKKETILLWIMISGFMIGLYFYNIVFYGVVYQHYFMVFYPIFIMLVAQVFFFVYRISKPVFWISILFYVSLNTYSLIHSSVRYPLYQKIEAVHETIPSIGKSKFSIHVSQDSYLQGGGWTELYTLAGKPPVKSYQYEFWDWIYRAYSLFPGPVQQDDPGTIVMIRKKNEGLVRENRVVYTAKLGDIVLDVLDNSESDALLKQE